MTYRCPGNTAVQVNILIKVHLGIYTLCTTKVYNYQQRTARVVFGPDLVILGPHETFNVLKLSGKLTNETVYVINVAVYIKLVSQRRKEH